MVQTPTTRRHLNVRMTNVNKRWHESGLRPLKLLLRLRPWEHMECHSRSVFVSCCSCGLQHLELFSTCHLSYYTEHPSTAIPFSAPDHNDFTCDDSKRDLHRSESTIFWTFTISSGIFGPIGGLPQCCCARSGCVKCSRQSFTDGTGIDKKHSAHRKKCIGS